MLPHTVVRPRHVEGVHTPRRNESGGGTKKFASTVHCGLIARRKGLKVES